MVTDITVTKIKGYKCTYLGITLLIRSREHIASTHVPWLAKRKVFVEFGTDQFGHDLVQCAAHRVDLVKPGRYVTLYFSICHICHLNIS